MKGETNKTACLLLSGCPLPRGLELYESCTFANLWTIKHYMKHIRPVANSNTFLHCYKYVLFQATLLEDWIVHSTTHMYQYLYK